MPASIHYFTTVLLLLFFFFFLSFTIMASCLHIHLDLLHLHLHSHHYFHFPFRYHYSCNKFAFTPFFPGGRRDAGLRGMTGTCFVIRYLLGFLAELFNEVMQATVGLYSFHKMIQREKTYSIQINDTWP